MSQPPEPHEEKTMSRPVLQPTAAHPITIEPTQGRVVVRIGDTVVADSRGALTLQESTYPAVQYIPMADVDQSVLRPTDTSTYCPFKGDASYYSVETPDGTVDDVIWTYQKPYAAVSEIADHVAFYANRAEVTVDPAGA
jgi:uncharacterized protein (DUF427 family)